MVTIILLRHGETATSKNHDLIEGCSDTSLTDVGREQARQSALKIKQHYEVEAIFCSPLNRAIQTGNIVSSVFGHHLQLTSFLRERNFGELEGKKWSEVTKLYGPAIRAADRNGTYDYQRFKGDSVEGVQKRIKLLKDFLRLQYEDKNVICVTHGGIFRLLGFDVPWTAKAEYKIIQW